MYFPSFLSRSRIASLPVTFVAILAVFIALSGCEPETDPPPEDPTLVPEETDPLTVVDVLQDDERFTSLVDALEQADLVQTLHGPGPFTVFAPTNEAFDALPEETRDALYEEEGQERLVEILTYHVVSGRMTADELGEMESMTTLHGSDISIMQENGDLLLDNEANVTDADIEADNGIVHAIDAVLMPADDDLADPATE